LQNHLQESFHLPFQCRVFSFSPTTLFQLSAAAAAMHPQAILPAVAAAAAAAAAACSPWPGAAAAMMIELQSCRSCLGYGQQAGLLDKLIIDFFFN
jgi:hypothetical protein